MSGVPGGGGAVADKVIRPPAPGRAPARSSAFRRRLRTEAPWLLAALAVVGVVWAVVLVHDPRHFFSGDTEQAYYGWWYTFGEALRHGQWPILQPRLLAYGNQIVNGQMGLYNPLIAVIGLGATLSPNLLVYATAIKFVVAAIGIVGGYGLVRSYRVTPPLAAAAAVAVALCCFTYEYSAPRWFVGQLGVALLPWAWWLTRRVLRGHSPFPALVVCFLIVSIGYVYPTMYLAVVLLVCLLEAIWLHGRRAALKTLLVIGFVALVTVVVYLPGVLTAPQTVRGAGGLSWSGYQKLGWWQLLTLWQPVGEVAHPMFGFWSWSPLEYVVWWLPLLLVVEPAAVRRRWREVVPLLVGALAWAVWCVGPAVVGPLRWPARTLEALTLMVAVFVIVTVSRCRPARVSLRRGAVVLGFVVLSELAMLGWHPHLTALPRLVSLVVLVALFGACLRWLRRPGRLGAVLLAGSLAFGITTALVPQRIEFNHEMPDHLAAYRQMARPSQGTIVQINASRRPHYTYARSHRLATGSLWSLTGRPVTNGYSPAEYAAFQERFPSTVPGAFRPRALVALRQREPTTHRRWLDLFGFSTVILERSPTRHWNLPHGWRTAASDATTITWERQGYVAPTGGISWVSPGTRVQVTGSGPLGLSFRVARVPAGGGSVVLSRIPWRGYRATGAVLAKPLDAMLLRLHVPASAVGKTVTLTYRPPGWDLEVLCLGLAGLLLAGWSGGWLWRRTGLWRTRREPERNLR